jgi:hypothetical protein
MITDLAHSRVDFARSCAKAVIMPRQRSPQASRTGDAGVRLG